jgi:hypothetical protein
VNDWRLTVSDRQITLMCPGLLRQMLDAVTHGFRSAYWKRRPGCPVANKTCSIGVERSFWPDRPVSSCSLSSGIRRKSN